MTPPSDKCLAWTATPPTEASKVPADPLAAAARLLVERALAEPGVREAARRPGAAIVVEVPEAGWVDVIADAFRDAVHPAAGAPADGDCGDAHPVVDAAAPWIEFRRSEPPRFRGDDDAAVALVLAQGRGVAGFSPSPRRDLPPALVRAADLHVTIPRPDAALLRLLVETLTGTAPGDGLAEPLCRLLGPEDLRLAWRPGQDAAACLVRLRRLAAAKAPRATVTLDDLAGMDEAVAWGRDLANDLREFRAGRLGWDAVDRGCLLAGPPGTGKTTFARALAASCGVPLIAGSLAAWQAAGHLGDLLKAMRGGFEAARKAAPSILFIDEIDSFGDRGRFTRYREYWTQVVNCLLEELDGLAGREGVVVVAACNHPDRLDPALTRAGRLDRVVVIPPPDRRALARILRFHLGADLAGCDLGAAALAAVGATGTDCERWVRGARRRARVARRPLAMADLMAEIGGDDRRSAASKRSRLACADCVF